ncbi:MarR family winged helix-turn-helix transcriptional regulator [Bradyrhizobium sp.]|uniref:MarR family winged helix-turn-helix transcriptional regulator n=1 Tax=Bradyrhizobium sp. TaxID=376 RepID=UPI002D472637|nr:MarR family transcriptional regulator [Bradyrhizobium sp.]HZR75370.1 MarR family transcriptional regulator [Bradyrhizobium sp.]
MSGPKSPASKSRLYHRLQLAAHRVQKSADRALIVAAEITTAQAAVLTLVARGAVSQREVAMQLGLNESALTAMAQRLLGMGLLERVRDEADARAWQLRLSGDGRAALKRIDQPFKGINQTIEAALTPDEIAQLADYLQRIASAFDET